MNIPETLDDVIFSFHQAADKISPELMKVWTSRYPQYSDEIRAHAVEIMDMEFLASVREDAKSKEAVTTAITLRAALQSMGTSLRDFADAIDLSRSVVSDLNSGRIETATIPRRFALRGASYLNSAVDWFQSVLSESCETAPTPAFKAKSMPSLGRKRTWQEAIRDSDMDDDRKAFWLSDED